ncbi:hypothetical protein HYQ44_015799 [Verticillium longisporum]|nr:hypothetical protein HYQ44_015799 [Verticillium longisporum]
MFLPFPVLLRAQIQRRKKLVLLGLLALGVFVTIIQIFRIQTVVLLANYLDSAPLIMWSTIENNLGVIVTCVPTLAPLVKAFRERSTGASGGPSQKYAAQGTGASSAARGGDFAMRSWRGRGSGIMPLGSGVDHELGKGTSDAGSTECILDGTGIVKKTEVVVTRDMGQEFGDDSASVSSLRR